MAARTAAVEEPMLHECERMAMLANEQLFGQ